jgi:hypothetical protein
MNSIIKYPRTKHIEGSNLQTGDDPNVTPMSWVKDKLIVIEEKLDGANTGISFEDGVLKLQSRGHYLDGGSREYFFNWFKMFANKHINELRNLLGDRYIMYGEYVFAKHTIFYDQLTSYFYEFDIYDKKNQIWLSTEERFKLLFPVRDFIKSVPVLYKGSGAILSPNFVSNLVTKSKYISDNFLSILNDIKLSEPKKYHYIVDETDQTGKMEGLYIKVETENETIDRYKWVRHGFLQVVHNSGHWQNRVLVKNLLAKK